MKIEETCTPEKPPVTYYTQIPIGTVFKHGNGKTLYLKLAGGVADLTNNVYYSQGDSNIYNNYTPFPAARVVLK